jgi:hypothetical protein
MKETAAFRASHQSVGPMSVTNLEKCKAWLLRAAESRPASWLVLGAFFWMVAAAGFSGFVGKWGLPGTAGDPAAEERFGLGIMLDGTAHKPFVYRQLVPRLAVLADRVTPENIKNYANMRLLPKKQLVRAISPPSQDFRFRFLVVYYSSFLGLFLSLLILRKVLVDLGVDKSVAVLAPAGMALVLPYIQTVGGFFYDSTELFFMSLAFLLASHGRIWLLVALVLPATLNKETFIFFLPTLFPVLAAVRSFKAAAAGTLGGILIAGILNVLVKTAFFHSPRGGAAEVHILTNLKYYLTPSNYLHVSEFTYGIVGPGGMFLGTLAVAAIVVLRAWPLAPVHVRRHFLIAALINVPLVLVFCAPGEMRNLSLLYVGLTVLLGFAAGRNARVGAC